MSGYLSGQFKRTGCEAFDNVLEAIEQAGDGFHHTEQWTEELDWGKEKGKSYIDLINEEIDKAATDYDALLADNERLAGALEDAIEMRRSLCVNSDEDAKADDPCNWDSCLTKWRAALAAHRGRG